MERDTIAKIEIDAEGRLHIAPSVKAFPFIYREALEVQWDANNHSLYSPKPRDWSYSRWFQQVLAAAREQGCALELEASTVWLNIEPGIKAELLRAVGSEA